jgi:2-hydroxychromene-2-carboxylate isomerase
MSDGTPKPFPQPTLNTQRALCAIELSHPEKLSDCFAALYQAFWVEGKTIGKPEIFGPVLEGVLGEQEGRKMVEAASQPEAKKKLSENSDLAMAEGAFGLPWFVATNSRGELLVEYGVCAVKTC